MKRRYVAVTRGQLDKLAKVYRQHERGFITRSERELFARRIILG